jgi:predicted Ser/Thr protein kinase
MPDDPHNPSPKAHAAVASSDAETVTFALPVDAVAAASERYDILAELGRGGMGIVYKARDRETSEIVALKVLRPELAQDAKRMERFKGELRLARQITHRNACRTHELLRFGATAVISMEFVEGESLRQLMDRLGGVRVPKAIQIAREICAALHEAHAAGIVHRDLKPENVMLDLGGSAKVMDFGIARSVGETSDSVGITGTPAYMAPEQASGQPVDHRADIYALGLILYELVTGACAFTGDTPVEIALKQLREMPPAPGDLDPGIPAHVERAILKCLAKSPDARFQSVDDLERALLQTSSPKLRTTELSMPSVAVALPARLTRWQRSDWVLFAAGVAGLAIFVALFQRAFPTYAMETVPFSREQAVDRARKLIGTVAPERKQIKLDASYTGGWFGMLDSGDAREFPVWEVFASEPNERAYVAFERSGKIHELDLHLTAPDDARVPPADVQSEAAKDAQEVFGTNVSLLKQVPYRFDAGLSRWVADGYFAYEPRKGTPVAWQLPDQGPFRCALVLFMQPGKLLGGGVVYLARKDIPSPSYSSTRRLLNNLLYFAMLGSCLLAAGLLLMFFVKGLYRSTQIPVLVVVTLIAFAAADMMVAQSKVRPSVVPAIIGFVVGLVLSYMLLAVAYYYAQNALPVQTRSFSESLTSIGPPQYAGLGLLRGIWIGFAYLACHSLILIGLRHWNILAAGTANLVVYAYDLPRAIHVPTGLWPLTFIYAPVVVSVFIFTALPAALSQRASNRTTTGVVVTGFVWMVTGSAALLGATTNELLPTLLLSALQGALFGFLLLRFDLLTCLAAVLTVETALIGYSIHRVFIIDSWEYSAGVVCFLLVAGSALLIYVWPHLVAFFRRVQAIMK